MKLPRKSKATEPPPVPKRRGRPRKQRRKENETVTIESKKTTPIVLIGRYVLKEFRKRVVLIGKVVSYNSGLYRVEYEDGGGENLNSSDIRRIVLNDCDFDDDLIRRKSELDESLLSKIVNELENNSSELHVANEDVTDVDSFNDSRDSCSDAETPLELTPLELPPMLQLPPSSGTIGVPENSVSHLFSVYGFLRSFSTRLFLSPFSLDEFVGALNCRVWNTLLDAVHVSLMRALRRHLENLSAEGSKIASKCLRCSEWSLLDTLTWPVFLIQYLAVNGYTKGSEWKGFYDEIFYGEYYSLPASRKLIILQILCDDVLESEELKAEMNMREESEVGANYDADEIPPTENGPKRVHAKTADCKDEECMNLVSELDAVNLPGNSEDEVDRNGDECRLCGMDGTLLCCDGCPAVYHSRCIGVMKMYIPEGAWYCPECKINKIGPTIAKGTSLKGAEIFGKDLYGQLFIGTCNHLLVLNVNSGDFCLKYYNQNDITEVIRVLYASMQHRDAYFGICIAMLQYWNIPESFLHLNSENLMIDANISAAALPPLVENDHKAVSVGKAEYGLTSLNGICSDNIAPSLNASLITTSPTREINGNAITKESPNMNMKLHKETVMGSVASIVNHQSETSYPNPDNRSAAATPAKCSLVSSQFINYGNANDMRLPMNLSLQTKGNQTGFGKCKGNITNDFVYMGCSYKPQSYINYYMHGDFAASAAANLAILSSEDSRSEGHMSDLRKATSENTNLIAKAFSLTVSRFFWPSSDKKLVEVPRERCGWCLSCKALVSSKKGCMLNQAALSATKSAMKVLSGLAPVRSGEGIFPSIATYVIYMEESLRGLIDGPFLSENYRKQWREQVEKATSFCNIKPLLLKLEENIRTIAFCGDWVKLMDEWLVESFTIQSATSTLGTTQKRASCARHRKQLPIKVTVDICCENFVWRNGKLTKSVFQKAALPKFMVRKAARRGGLKKILGIVYPDVSEIPKRSRQLVWRAAVQTSRNASQLALQVRYLDFHIRWIDLIRPEYNFQDGKGQDTEASAFRNANICDKKVVEGKTFYGIAFGSQKHIPSRVMKNVEIDQGPEGKKFWFSETRVPLYLVKEYEVSNVKEPSHKDHLNIASQLHKRRLNAICKDIFFYLTCKRDKLDTLPCSVCQLGVLLRNALKCSACQGYCHEGCSLNSTFSTFKEVEFLTTCKKCNDARLLIKKEHSIESTPSPLTLKAQEHSSLAISKPAKPKCYDQIPRSSKVKDCRPDMKQVASHPPVETKSRRRNTSWGIIWKKNNSEDTGFDFRLKNILLKRSSSLPGSAHPVCHLCRKSYRPDLMYIRCEMCTRWYHAEAIELEESKIFSVLGFKCCRCRKIKSPLCPYSGLTCKEQNGEKSYPRASKIEHSRADSGSGTQADIREYSGITEPKSDSGIECDAVSGPGLQETSTIKNFKPEGDNNGSFRGEVQHAEFSTLEERGNLPAELLSPFSEHDSLFADCNLLSDSEIADDEYMGFGSQTRFSLSELLHLDNSSQFEEADAPGDLSGFSKNSCTLDVPEKCATASLQNNWRPTISSIVHNCFQCSQSEPAPDLSCQICGMWIHSQCSPWIESPSRLGDWRCGNCREWL
ncbi:DDT domain-containing protein PTM isoform X2 [Cicer arietinum]|uniref:DDT domain-containing protein PTM isoform X2 n=1 Tax=Cicer arietinum TaxID=3827 RepID=A0A1S3EB08_CICAR|nr:DDT domain-containing protein PTM isoform X2 [Cicer arietinum]